MRRGRETERSTAAWCSGSGMLVTWNICLACFALVEARKRPQADQQQYALRSGLSQGRGNARDNLFPDARLLANAIIEPHIPCTRCKELELVSV